MTVPARLQFVPPPNWPQPPAGWEPPPGWQPPAAWGPAPVGWQFWQPQAGVPLGGVPGAQPNPLPVDGFAITALITGIIASPVLSGIFGGVALSRIRKGRGRGRALVFVGWAICLVWIAAIVIGVANEVAQGPLRSSSGTITRAGEIAPMDLQVGDCVKVPDSVDTVARISVMPCGQLHNAQVFADLRSDALSYPGDDALLDEALDECSAVASRFLGTRDTDLRVVAFIAEESGWRAGDHSEKCLLIHRGSDITGDIRQHR